MTNSIELLTVDDVARLLKTTKDAVYQMRSRGQLPGATKIGKRAYFRADLVYAWLRELPTTPIPG